MRRHDVVVVGAGPAGAVAAREICRLGASVLLVDRSDFPRRKVCGACLSAGALEILASVGLADVAAVLGAEPLRAFVLSADGASARLRLGGGCAVSRTALDAALVRAARDAGAEVHTGAGARLGPARPGYRVVHVGRGEDAFSVRAGVVLDATGLGPGLTAAGMATSRVARGSRLGVGATFEDPGYPVAKGDLHMAVAREGYVGLVRVESGALNVAAAVDPRALRGGAPGSVVADILQRSGLPALSRSPSAPWRGTPLLTRSAADVGCERVLRLGDAAGYVEPFTGEGMCWAMSAAAAVAPLAVEGAARWRSGLLESWHGYHRTALGRARRMCGLLAPALRRPGLVRGAVAVLGAFPSLARPMVRRASRPPRPSAACPSAACSA